MPSGPGTYDNRGSLDYHIPVEGAFGPKPPPLHICHIAVEMAPIAKVRGAGGGGGFMCVWGGGAGDQGCCH